MEKDYESKKKYDVAIIILNWNGKDLLKNCLKSIEKLTLHKSYKIFVVDNNSKDGSQEMIKKEFKKVDLHERKVNDGFARANNEAIKIVKKKYDPKYYFLLNNDTLVTKGWLTGLLNVANKTHADILGPKQYSFENKPGITGAWFYPFGIKYYRGNKIKEVDWVSGACYLINKRVFEKIGFLDEGFTFYYEETDFEKRAKNAGFKIFCAPSSKIYHKGGATSVNLSRRWEFYTFFSNRMRFFMKNYSVFYFLPRLIWDFIRALISSRVGLLIKAYKDGYKSLKNPSSLEHFPEISEKNLMKNKFTKKIYY